MKTRSFVSLVLLSLFLASPALAASPFVTGDDAFAFDIAAQTSAGSGKAIDVRGTWLHYTGDHHRTGVNLLYLNKGEAAGYGLGPSYEWVFADLKRGALFVGGDASMLGSDLGDAGNFAMATRLGYEFYAGQSAIVRLQGFWQDVVQPEPTETAAEIDSYGVLIGIALGVKPNTTVQ